MNKIQSFEDLIIWQRSQLVFFQLFELFKDSKQYYFRDQICRAALSVSNNIAEGHDRGSRKDYTKFLVIARASNSEVRSMLYLAEKMYPQKKKEFEALKEECHAIGKMIYKIIQKLKQ